MSGSENIAVVESYLNGLASKDLSPVPFAPDITFDGPLMPKLVGREKIVGFLTSIFPFINGIEIKDGDYVATVFDMETANGVDLSISVKSFAASPENGLPSRSVAATSRWIRPSGGAFACILTGSDDTVALNCNLRSFKLTISTGHTNDGQKAKEETRQNSSLRSQSLTSLGLAPSGQRSRIPWHQGDRVVEDRY